MPEANLIELKNINGHRRLPSGVYAPTKEALQSVLERCKIAPEPAIPYMPQGREMESMDIYRKTGKSVLLVGPTGKGKRPYGGCRLSHGGMRRPVQAGKRGGEETPRQRARHCGVRAC